MSQTDHQSSNPPKTEPPSYVLKWEDREVNRQGWHIRGITADRTFYGEVIDYGRHIIVNATGQLSEADYAEFLQLINDLKSHASLDNSRENWIGLLAEGPIHKAQVFYQHYQNITKSNDNDERFLKIIDLMRPYVCKPLASPP
jgi:hypothetical protein